MLHFCQVRKFPFILILLEFLLYIWVIFSDKIISVLKTLFHCLQASFVVDRKLLSISLSFLCRQSNILSTYFKRVFFPSFIFWNPLTVALDMWCFTYSLWFLNSPSICKLSDLYSLEISPGLFHLHHSFCLELSW